ncbi:MAG: glycoside hydrolase family 31 protein, partial [Spirochaetes bacterium]|nr:glycoside hydrolase family 31 protein [Spirochaetota bacterium]
MFKKKRLIIIIALFFFISTGYSSEIISKEELNNGWLFKTNEAQIKLSTTRENVFHIMAILSKSNWEDKQGVFVIPNPDIKTYSQSIQKFEESDLFGIKTNDSIITISKNSQEICLINKAGDTVLEKWKLIFHSGDQPYWEVIFTCTSNERNYGIGNPEMGKSGGLLKSYAVTSVGNGISKLPFYWSTAGYGILIDFEKKGMIWRKRGNTHFLNIPDKVLDIYIILGNDPYQILDVYTNLTGKPPIPPRWSFGFMLSRWGYKGWEDVKDKWETFRAKKIPVDVFIYDYDWFKKDWEWDFKTFPDPKANLQLASKMGIKFIGIRKPRCDYKENLDFIKEREWLLFGTSSDINFVIPEARKWWWDKQIPLFKTGIAGWWNDEAENSLLEYYYMVLTQLQGMQKIYPDTRVWTINRAFSPGLQRLGAAVWTGDVAASWQDLQNQPGTFLNYGMLGMPYSSSDIGGFHGKPSGELYTRWIQLGIFTPVMRAHGVLNSPRWPWAFGEDVEDAVKKAIELRYTLIPYLYSCARIANLTGAPINRALFFEFGDDPQSFGLEDQWLVGRGILVAPILNPDGIREIYLPAAKWYEFETGKIIEGPNFFTKKANLDVVPIYIREGTILPLGPVMQHTDEINEMSLTINIYAGKDGAFSLYLDDGKTHAYDNGDYNETIFEWNQENHTLIINEPKGKYKGYKKYLINKINVFGVNKPEQITLDNNIQDFVYHNKKNSIEIKCNNLGLDKKYVLKINTTTKQKTQSNKKFVEQSNLEILAAKQDVKAINTLIRRLSKADSTEKCRIINALSPSLNQDKVYDIIKKLLNKSDLIVKKTILKNIKGYSPGLKYTDLILSLAFNENKEIASLSQ